MAKKNAQTKGDKQIGKKAKKIKEKIMNKVEDQIENAQIKDLETDQKTPPIIEEETTEKSVENAQETTISDVGTDDLVSVLKIPMQDANTETEMPDVHSAIFDGDAEEEEEEEEIEDLNDKYFKSDDDDFSDPDASFFEDEKLMAEMGVEIIDLGMQTLAMGIAQDFDNPEKYAVSDYKKNKIKKPLELLLRKRGAKVSPEVMFGVVLLVVYAPTMISAVQERKEKMKAKNKAKVDVAEQIPDGIQEVHPMPEYSPPPKPMVVPVDPPKKKGRPKGSKDSKKRSTKGYKGNSNAS
tara:strand:- start:45 stop:929 length:885 start_codon:yes stop_codon:yes gene_type:complete